MAVITSIAKAGESCHQKGTKCELLLALNIFKHTLICSSLPEQETYTSKQTAIIEFAQETRGWTLLSPATAPPPPPHSHGYCASKYPWRHGDTDSKNEGNKGAAAPYSPQLFH